MNRPERQAKLIGSFGAVCAVVWLALLSPRADAELVLFDTFDYVVGRTEANTTAIPKFQTGGWSSAKRMPTNTGAVGYLYTVSQAEMQATTGYSGPMPGGGSRVLKMEVPPGTGQTDFWLNYSGGANTVPGNVWFQFWIYSNHYGSEQGGLVDRTKFLYPTNNGYPSSTDKWLFVLSSWTAMPQDSRPYGVTTGGEFAPITRDSTVGTVNYSAAADSSNVSKLGPNLVSGTQGLVQANRWTLVKVHYDTSVANRGVFEVWLRPYGGSWTKTTEWIGGVTRDFTWTGFPAGGHSEFRMPTTIPAAANATNNVGSYYYMDDFAMATSEDSLPVYDGVRPSRPTDAIAE